MLKTDAIELFKECSPKILARKNAGEIRQAWNEFVDGLQKSRAITEAQASRWVNPFLSKKHR